MSQETFGQYLRRKIKEAGRTEGSVAEEVGATSGMMSRWVTTKSRRPRRVTLTDGAVKILKSIGPSTGLVFPGRDGRPLHGSVLPKGHKRWCEKAGVPVIRMHDIRHTTATLLLEQGVHPKVVAEILGHSSIQITLDLYSHVSDELGRSAIDRMGDLLS